MTLQSTKPTLAKMAKPSPSSVRVSWYVVAPFENPEGDSRSRNVVIEFPSYQAALDCWNSPEYRAAAALRAGASVMDLVIIPGYDGPQPVVVSES